MTAAGSATTTRRRFPLPLLAAGGLAVLVFAAAYSNSLRNGFHFDDIHVVSQNLFVHDLTNAPRFFTDARTFSSLPQNAVYRPLVTLSLAIDYAIAGGLRPLPFHVTQLLLFASLGAMLLAFYSAVFATAGTTARLAPRWIALFGATLFCVHTANTQTGNYISARSELLSAIGVVGAFLVYLRAPGLRRYYVYLLPMVVGALAKNLAVTFAPLLLAYKLLIEEQLSVRELVSRQGWPRTRAALISSIPAFVAAGALFVFVERMSPPGQTYGGGSRGAYLATQAWVWVRYVALYFVPVGLTADTDLKLFPGADVRTLAGLLLLAGSLALVWWASRTPRTRPIAFGILWFWIALGPTSSIFPLAEVTNDHRMFLPYVGLNLAMVWLFALPATRTWQTTKAARRGRVALAVAAPALLLAHASGTFQRNAVWRDDESLWRDVVAKSPGNGRGRMNYGIALMQRGRLVEARDLFLQAQQFSPNYSYLEVNLGIVSDALNDQASSEAHFRRALALEPDQPAVHRHYAHWLLRHGRGPEAIEQLTRLVMLSPGDGDARDRLMQVYAALDARTELTALASESARLDRTDGIARAYANGAVPLAPQSDDGNGWYLLGWSLTQGERHLEAAQAYRIAVSRDAGNATAWNNLGWTLGKLGFFAAAMDPLQRALTLRPTFQLARNNLAWVRSEVGRAARPGKGS